MRCKGTGAKVLSPDGESKLFDILAVVLQGLTYLSYRSTTASAWGMPSITIWWWWEVGLYSWTEEKKDNWTEKYLGLCQCVALLSEDIRTATEHLHRVRLSSSSSNRSILRQEFSIWGENRYIVPISNCFYFPKFPSKSRLSLLIVKIIALRDRQYWPQMTETMFQFVTKKYPELDNFQKFW